jgi:single-strand DNA-binding protein
MFTVNKVILLGRVGAKPDSFNSGTSICCKFGVATSNSYTNSKGEQVDETEWHNIVAFNKFAEICLKLLDKGSIVYIEGRIKTNKWGEKTVTEVILEKVVVLSSSQTKSATSSQYKATDKPNASYEKFVDSKTPF